MTSPIEPWTASISALGPITQQTPLTVEALVALLPGYRLELSPAPYDAPDNPFIVARSEGDDAIAMEIIGHRETGSVVTVRVFEHGRILNAFVIGSKFSETLLKRDRCFRGEGKLNTHVTCAMEDEPWLLYWFTSPEIAADVNIDPPEEEVLADGAIAFISWIPWRTPDETDT